MTRSERKARKLVERCKDTYLATFPKGHWLRVDRAHKIRWFKRDQFGRYTRGYVYAGKY